jgi:hypothetical protein
MKRRFFYDPVDRGSASAVRRVLAYLAELRDIGEGVRRLDEVEAIPTSGPSGCAGSGEGDD